MVLARADNFPDALVGAPLAAAKSAPLLFTSGRALPAATEAEIRRVLAPGKAVYLLGGPSAIPDDIVVQLMTLGYSPIRIAGDDRFATAVAVADALGDPSTVFLASGSDFADALTAGPAATKAHGAVLLTSPGGVNPETAAYLSRHATTVLAIGGPAAAADPDRRTDLRRRPVRYRRRSSAAVLCRGDTCRHCQWRRLPRCVGGRRVHGSYRWSAAADSTDRPPGVGGRLPRSNRHHRHVRRHLRR